MSLVTLISSPLGKLELTFEQAKLIRLTLLPESTQTKQVEPELGLRVSQELQRYFDNPKHGINIDYALAGSSFQQTVWRALQTIPSGETLTYGQLAKRLNTSPRAIGQACRTNPLPIVIPCHRVVAAEHLGGYAGARTGKLLDMKKWLLQHEGYASS